MQKLTKKKNSFTGRYPNLNTVLMVEDYLNSHRDIPITLAELRTVLPRQGMDQTLKIILEYLWASGKIIYGPRGVQWIYQEPDHIKKMLENSLEI